MRRGREGEEEEEEGRRIRRNSTRKMTRAKCVVGRRGFLFIFYFTAAGV